MIRLTSSISHRVRAKTAPVCLPALAIAGLAAVGMLASGGIAPGHARAQAVSKPSASEDMPDRRQIARAEAVLKAIEQQKWFIVDNAIKSIGHKALGDLLQWHRYRRGASQAPFAEVADFFIANSDWPLLPEVRRKVERDASAAPRKAVLAWFKRFPPITAEGCSTYVAALKAVAPDKAREAAERCWIILPLSEREESAFLGRHGGLISPAAHIDRVRHMLRSGRTKDVKRLIEAGRLPPDEVKLLTLRMKLRDENARSGQVAMLRELNAVPDKERNEPDFLFDEIRWHRRRGATDVAIKRFDDAPDRPVFDRRWWVERSILVHRLMRAGRWKQAYALVSGHRQWGSGDPAEPEALAGWIALRHLKDPTLATMHFQRVWFTAPDRRDRAMAAYWLGQTAEAAKKPKLATGWFRVAASEVGTFYGQLARLDSDLPDAVEVKAPQIAAADRKAFNARSLTQATRLQHELDPSGPIRPFLVRLVSSARSQAELQLAARLARDIGEMQASVRVARLALRKGPVDPALAFPRPDMPSDLAVEPALVLAIIRQESEFNPKARSPAGARGLMQLLPGTARQMARSLKIPFNEGKLTEDPAYNMKLGASYLRRLLEKYRGSIVLAAAAYNAGPSRIDDWIKRHGHPASRRIDAIDWIIRVPYGETRDYVQKVLTNYLVYRALLGRPIRKGGVEANWTADLRRK